MDKFVVSQNGVEIEIGEQKVQKGISAGKIYHAPEVDNLTLTEIVGFFGEDRVLSDILRPTIRRISLGIDKQAAKDATVNGTTDPAKFVELYNKMFSELSISGETLSVLEDRLEDLLEQQSSIVNPDIKFVTVDGKPQMHIGDDPKTQKFVKLSMEVMSCQEAINKKRAEKAAAKAEKEAATPATVAA